MGSELHLISVRGNPEAAVDTGERRVRQLESLWSRYLPSSEISTINANPGTWRSVSPETYRLLSLAATGTRLTGGLFQPLADPTTTIHLGEASTVMVDAPFDPNGIGKGLASDMAVKAMLESCEGALVSIGGDIRASGASPSPEGWMVQVEDPTNRDREVATVRLSDGAVVTSSTRHGRRRDASGNRVAHVLDPRTGRLITDDLTVTVVAAEGWAAEVFATAALVAGGGAAIDLLDSVGISGLAVGPAGLSVTARVEVFA